jgi:hypothetical protein
MDIIEIIEETNEIEDVSENPVENDSLKLSINTLEEKNLKNKISFECGSKIFKKSSRKHFKSIRHELFLLKKELNNQIT